MARPEVEEGEDGGHEQPTRGSARGLTYPICRNLIR
jgi:hypothetical protein